MSKKGAESPSPVDRARDEARCTFARLVELHLDPVRGQFDAAHLREINRRIFQDLPGLGYRDVTPGQYRPPVPAGRDWYKERSLQTVDATSCVAYSPMDAGSLARLDAALASADPAVLGKLSTVEFVAALGKLYAELDYLHPFPDGNSRTLREFTRQLAEQAGYALDWQRFNKTAAGRDLLYVARDLSVNRIALPHLQDQRTRQVVQLSLDRFEGNRDLSALLSDAVSSMGR